MSAPIHVVLSCEHAGNEVPEEYADLFESVVAREALASHRGWDPGSLPLGEAMSAVLGVPLVVQRVSRLLVECNRSLHHPRLFSEFARSLTQDQREEVVERYWRPHRERVRELLLSATLEDAVVVHVGVHTFTPAWKGRERGTDIGLLYDPARSSEAEMVRSWRTELIAMGGPPSAVGPDIGGSPRVHLNRPYRGWTDGLTTAFRREFPEARYVGIELEVSQRLVRSAPMLGRWIAEALTSALGPGLSGS